MKRKNFPGRRMMRRIDAEKRIDGKYGESYTDDELKRIYHAESIKSKRGRS